MFGENLSIAVFASLNRMHETAFIVTRFGVNSLRAEGGKKSKQLNRQLGENAFYQRCREHTHSRRRSRNISRTLPIRNDRFPKMHSGSGARRKIREITIKITQHTYHYEVCRLVEIFCLNIIRENVNTFNSTKFEIP